MPADPDALAKGAAIIAEYDRRPLDGMLGAAVPSVFGFAAVLMERLVMVVPGLVSVEVEESDGPVAVIERPAR